MTEELSTEQKLRLMKAAPQMLNGLRDIARMTFDPWTNGAIAGGLAREIVRQVTGEYLTDEEQP